MLYTASMRALLLATITASVTLIAARGRAEPLTFEAALALASQRADVRASQAELGRRAQLDRRIRRTGGNPQLYLQPGWRTAPSGDEGFELQAQITQQISLAGAGRARRRTARAERRALDLESRTRELVACLETAGAWIALWAATRQQALLDERRDLVRRWDTLVRRARDLGAATTVDEALVAALRGELDELTAGNHQRIQAASAALAAAMGRADPTITIEGDPPPVRLPPLGQLQRVDASALPGALLARAAVERERSRLDELRAMAGPNLSIGGLVALDSPGGVVVSGILSATLPVFERGQRGQATQSGALARAEIDAEGALRSAQRMFASCVAELARAREAETTLRESTLPSMASLTEAYRRRRAAGEVVVFEELEAQRRWLDARARAVDAHAKRVWSEVRVRLLLDALEDR